MKIIKLFIIYIIFFSIFYWTIKKTGFCKKLFNKHGKRKYFKVILIATLLFLLFLLEYAKQLLNSKYGHPNYLSLIVGAFIFSIYMSFGHAYLKEVIGNIDK